MISEFFNEMTGLSDYQLFPLGLVLAFVVGVVLGVVFFGGLWWTLHRGLRADRSPLSSSIWFPSSLLLRSSITVFGFYLVGAGQWQRIFVCLLGFLLARLIVTRVFATPLTTGKLKPENSISELIHSDSSRPEIKNQTTNHQRTDMETDHAS